MAMDMESLFELLALTNQRREAVKVAREWLLEVSQ